MKVETAYAPELLIYVLSEIPSIDEQIALRGRMVGEGHLQSHTAALIDFRAVKQLPSQDDAGNLTIERGFGVRRRAYVVANEEQSKYLERLRLLDAHPNLIAVCADEKAALKFLFPNPTAFPLSFLS